VHRVGLVCTARLIAGARRLAALGRVSRVASPWIGHGRWPLGVCDVVLPGRLAPAGQRSLRSVGDLCGAGYREEGRPSVSGWAWR
jgi:hypothetical protein